MGLLKNAIGMYVHTYIGGYRYSIDWAAVSLAERPDGRRTRTSLGTRFAAWRARVSKLSGVLDMYS